MMKLIKVFLRRILRLFGLFVPPGHFYSPIPSIKEIRQSEEIIWANPIPMILPGLDLNLEKQLKLMDEFKPFYDNLPFTDNKTTPLRYYFQNSSYSYSDAIFLHCIMRKFQPTQIIEIGSGFSSAVMMDTNELFFNQGIKMIFIEPHPKLLFFLMKPTDHKQYSVFPEKLQNFDLNKFSDLKENDILFVDSTHVAKINSDVNRLFFEILPRLNKGVLIHFHDIFFPFEYPKVWAYEGRAWNESYILRAFLQYNDSFEIVFFNTFLEHFFRNKFESEMPLCLKNPGGSIWIRKIH